MSTIQIIYEVFYLLPLLAFFFFKSKKKEWAVRVIFFYVIYCIVQEIATNLTPAIIYSYLSKTGLQGDELRKQTMLISSKYVLILFATYTIIEFTFFCLFYQFLFPEKHPARKYTTFTWIGFTSFALIDYFFINRHQTFDSFVSGIESLILIVMCGYYLYYQVTHTMNMMVYNTFNFWVIVTFFMFVSATFFLYLLSDAMGKDPEFRKYYLYINIGANVLKNLLLAYAFTRVFIPPASLKKDSISELDLGDALILQQNN